MTAAKPIPYPADTRARGWRFELDYEQIEQSDTWDMAGEIPMAQHALLMMWLVAWRQEPCGSFPNDEAVIRAKCRIPPKVWTQCRGVLMRGWWLAEDGRLYHDTIATRVLAMLEKREKDAVRAANRRARQHESGETHAGVTSASRVTPPGVPPEFDTKHQAPITPPDGGVGTRKRAAPIARPIDVTAQTWNDWLQLRKAKKAPVTQTVLDGAQREAEKAGMPLEQFLGIWVMRGSQGLQAEWLRADERRPVVPVGEPAWRTEQRARTQQAAPGVASGSAGQFIVDADAREVPARTGALQ